MPADSGEDDAWPERPGVTGPAGWFWSVDGEAAPPFRHGSEPARSDGVKAPAGRDEDQAEGAPEDVVPQKTALWPWVFQAGPQHIPVTGPAQPVPGRAGGTARTAGDATAPVPPPAAASGMPGAGQRSGWQRAGQAWEERGLRWEQAAEDPAAEDPAAWDPAAWDPAAWDVAPGDAVGQDTAADEAWPARSPSAGWNEYPPGGLPGQAWQSGDGDRPGRPSAPRLPFTALPLGAPVAAPPAEAPPAEAPPVAAPPAEAEPVDADELFRAWQGSVRQAAGRRRAWTVPWAGRPAGRRRMWRVVTIAVPVAVIVTVGVGALMMLTGRANEMLAVQGNTATAGPRAAAPASARATASGVPPTAASAGMHGASSGTDATLLPGYPGQDGRVTVAALRSADGVSVAVGGAGSHPAIWRRTGNGWSPEAASLLGAVPGTARLTAVTHGPDGWLATGSTKTAGVTVPLVLASADGRTWRPVASLTGRAGHGVTLNAAAAGAGGYVVAGKRSHGGRTIAVFWWSANLRTWTAGSNGHLDGRQLQSAVDGIAADGGGFIAAGWHGAFQAVWTSSDGRQWSVRNIQAPSGMRSAALRVVAASGAHVVAAGSAAGQAGRRPVVVTSADGGAHWREFVLSTPDGGGLATALTAFDGGFLVAGMVGPATGRHPVTWASPDGIRWPAGQAVQPLGGRTVGRITALDATGATVTGAAGQGTGSVVATVRTP